MGLWARSIRRDDGVGAKGMAAPYDKLTWFFSRMQYHTKCDNGIDEQIGHAI